MPPKRRPKPFEQGAGSKGGNNGNNSIRSIPANSKTRPKPPESPGFAHSTASWRRPKNVSNPEYKVKIETLWKKMGISRATERQNAIKNALIADPNKRTTLAKAIRVVGTCQDMCPEFERIQRIRENAIDRAEKTSLHGGAKVADEAKMVKAFHRPDAGKEEQLPSDLRPPAVLQITVRYLLDQVASPASSLAEHHKFVWDRTRCIRNDFTIQASGKLEDIKIAIHCYEEIARFHILSLHQMPNIGKHDYDAQQELEQLSATLLTLFEYYDDNRTVYEAPFEAEFRAYKLLIDIRSRTNDALERVQTWPPRVRDSLQVQTAIQLYHASGSTVTDTLSMLSPYARSVQVEAAHYAKFWSILESSKVDYLMACAAAASFNEIRARTLETMAKVYRSGPTSRLHDLSLDELTFSLGLDSKSQTKSLLSKSGLTISRHANGVPYLDLDELSGPFPKNAIATAEQIFSRSIVEVKRQDRVFGAVYKGLTVEYCKENGLVDELDGDAEFEPDPEDMDSEDEQDSLFVDGMEEDEPVNGVSSISSAAMAHVPNPTVLAQHGPQSGAFLFSDPSSASSPGNLGQSSAPEILSQTPSSTSSLLPTASPFTQTTKFNNPFAASETIPGIFSSSNTGNTSFGQPSIFSAKPSEPLETSAASTKLTDVIGKQGSSFMSAGSDTGLSEATPAKLFQWKPSTTSQSELPSQAPFSSNTAFAGFSGQPPQKSMVNTTQSTTEADASVKAPLHTFIFPPATNSKVNDIFSTTSKESRSTFSQPFPEIKGLDSTETSSPATAHGSMFSGFQLQTQNVSPVALSSSFQPSTEQQHALGRATPANTSFFQPASSTSSLDLGSFKAAPVSASTEDSSKTVTSKFEAVPFPNRDDQALIFIRPPITQEQIDNALNVVARDLFLGQYGVLEQFIEAQMGPIYDKVQRQVAKEQRGDRLAIIRHSLVQSKFFYLWRWRIDGKLRKRRVMQRRERMRQSQRGEVGDTSADHEARDPTYGGSISPQVNGHLKYLTRGFQDTFGKSTSSNASSIGKEASPTVHVMNHGRDGVSGKAFSMSSGGLARDRRYMRHSNSRSVDGFLRAPSLPPSSSSMPPPNRSSLSKLGSTRREMLKPKPFIGGGFLEDEGLRREAINLARRTGTTTTTESDYFRLKARNIDPNTKAIPWTRKRGRDSHGNETNGSFFKTRRFSGSSVSSIPASQSPPNLSSITKPSETEPEPSNSQSQTANLKFTVEEDSIFAAAQRLRETLAEDTEWMRRMREEYEREGVAPNVETAAQRRLREFKMTPSKTNIRLRQTLANGLLPSDYFDKQSTERNGTKNAKASVENDVSESPTPKMGLAVLSRNRNKHHIGTDKSGTLNNRGASVDDAIEL